MKIHIISIDSGTEAGVAVIRKHMESMVAPDDEPLSILIRLESEGEEQYPEREQVNTFINDNL